MKTTKVQVVAACLAEVKGKALEGRVARNIANKCKKKLPIPEANALGHRPTSRVYSPGTYFVCNVW